MERSIPTDRLRPSGTGFQWGTTTSYGTSTNTQFVVGGGTSAVPETAAITGLTPGTVFHYRILASDGLSITYGADEQFTTATTPQQVVETFSGAIGRGGSSFYSFPVLQAGSVSLTLTSLTNAASTTLVGLGLGTPAAGGCTLNTSANVAAGATPQLSASLGAGISCAEIFDVGNLTGSSNFSITIAHP